MPEFKQNHDIGLVNPWKIWQNSDIWERTGANQNLIHGEFKCRLNCGNPCWHSVHTSSDLSPVNIQIKIKIFRTIIFLEILHGHETWPLPLREEHKLRVLKTIFVPRNP